MLTQVYSDTRTAALMPLLPSWPLTWSGSHGWPWRAGHWLHQGHGLSGYLSHDKESFQGVTGVSLQGQLAPGAVLGPALSFVLLGPSQEPPLTWLPEAAAGRLICSWSIIRASSWGSGRFTNTFPASFLVDCTQVASSQPHIPMIGNSFLPPPPTPITTHENPKRIKDWPEVTQHG